MDDTIQRITLASLLHDIGKFAQRAGREKTRDMEGEYCPTDQKTGRPSHTHVLYTDHFIEHELPLPPELEGMRSALARMASSHHKPDLSDLLEMALCRGDCLSAGSDRIVEEHDAGDFKSARLVSIFDMVALRKKNEISDSEKLHYYSLKPIDKDAFPTSLAKSRESDYGELFEAFLTELKKIRLDMGVRHYINSLTSLLEKYTWCIPSSTYHTLPDISLYDHALTTAAIAQALAVYHREEGGFPGEKSEDAKKFILFGGDLSGIQKYIFGLDKSHGTGVAKLFRARSFYLQAITKSVILSLLDRLELLAAAKIMDAGGRFILLLPASARVRDVLPEFEREVQQWFVDRFRGELALNCSYAVELAENDLALKRFQAKLDEFNDHLEKRKLSKFDMLMSAGISPLVAKDYEEFADGNCAVCTTNAADSSAMAGYEADFGRKVAICRSCYEQISLIGGKLPDPANRFLVFSRSEGNKNSIALFDGMAMSFAKEVRQADSKALEITNIRDRGGFAFHAIAGHLPMITVEDMNRWRKDGLLKEENGGETYLGDRVEAGMPKTFQVLAGESREVKENKIGKKEIRGKAFLGAFKADVDNLGFIFSIGLNERLSVSRFAGMSRMLNHFFADYLVSRIRNEFPDVYVVFAGGDDLFLLGPWTRMVEFASFAQKEFSRFVSGNPEVTLSAGVAVTKPGLPVHTIAALAEHLLEQSKKMESKKKEKMKNAVTLFDTTVGWQHFDELLETGEWLERLVVEEKITAGLARRFLQYSDDFVAFMGGNIARGMYLSHMSYDFVRNVEEKKLSEKEKIRLYGIKNDEFLLQHMRLPLSCALYKLRTDK